MKLKQFNYQKLYEWYHLSKRDLPFRNTKDPYCIWVSEVMLQQTQVETMLPYYEKFLNIYPTIDTLAKSDLESVLSIVQGIGYYRRFKLMHQGAIYVMKNHQGVFPSTYNEVIKVPGIGRYTAGAIMSIAFNQPHSATDGNVIRVLSRYLILDDDFRTDLAKRKVDQINQKLIENTDCPHDFTQSMMELGAKVCRPLNPQCQKCPLNEICLAKKHNMIQDYPNISALNAKKELIKYHFILSTHEGFLMRKREENLLHGLYEFIDIEAESLPSAILSLEELNIDAINLQEIGKTKHIFTHQIWYNHVITGILVRNDNEQYTLKQNPYDYPMSTVHKRIFQTIKK